MSNEQDQIVTAGDVAAAAPAPPEPAPAPPANGPGAPASERAGASAGPPPPPPAAPDALAIARFDALAGGVAALGARLGRLEEAVAGIADQLGYLPPQVRGVGAKIEGLAGSINEPRLRALLFDLLTLHDLADQMARAAGVGAGARAGDGNGPPEPAAGIAVLRDQIRQVLAVNGLSEIPADGAFDPRVHRAMARRATGDRDQDGRIVELLRPGFRTEKAVLRFAEVAVAKWDGAAPAPAPAPAPAAASESASAAAPASPPAT